MELDVSELSTRTRKALLQEINRPDCNFGLPHEGLPWYLNEYGRQPISVVPCIGDRGQAEIADWLKRHGAWIATEIDWRIKRAIELLEENGMCAVNKDDLQYLITDYNRIKYALEEARINDDCWYT